MTLQTLAYGPVELDVILLNGDAPSPGLLHALAAQIRSGVVRLLDFVVVTRTADEITIREVDLDEFGLGDLHLHIPGLSAEEDLLALGDRIPQEGSAAIVAFELLWAKELSQRLAQDGSVVVATERIPAPVVNAIVEIALDD